MNFQQMATPREILRYCNRLGFRAGLQTAGLHRPPGAVRTVKLDNVAHPIAARTGTSDVKTFDEVFVKKEYDLPFDDFTPEQILDLGANIGYASIWFASRWPGARILSVEPDAENFQMLRRNAEPWQNRITPLLAAVWHRPATVQVVNPKAAANAFQVGESSAPGETGVQGYTVAQLMEKLGCERLGLLKMDVEGAEAELFRHNNEWLDRVDVLVVELHDRLVPGCAEALCDALRGRRFRQEIMGLNLAIDLRNGRKM
jgi:FkbM family methyltransferase